MKSLCAICTDNPGDHFEPLGRNDCMVPVCRACETEKPRRTRIVERGFEPSGGLPSSTYRMGAKVPRGSFNDAGTHGSIQQAIKLTDGNEDGFEMAHAMAAVRRPGARLHRIPRIARNGECRTFDECLSDAESRDWYGRSEFYNSDARWYVWQEVA